MAKQNRTHLLIVDSSADALVSLRSALLESGQIEKVVTADSGEAAMRLVKDTPPQAVIADIRLADMSGMRLLLLIKGMHPQILTVMTSDCGSEDARKMCREAGIDSFFEKPVDVSALLEEVTNLEAAEKSFFRGQLNDLKIPDILQLIVSRPVPMLIRLDGPRGEGCIEIENGQVIHARCNGRVGEEAFFEIAGWDQGAFEVINVLCPQERTITASLNNLLINAAGRMEQSQPAAAEQDAAPEADFLPKDASAPEVSYVWAPMSHYKTPNVKPKSQRRPSESKTPVSAQRSSASQPEASPLRLKVIEPLPPPRLTDMSRPVRPGSKKKSRKRGIRIEWRAHVKELALAGVAAALVLVAGVRYLDVMEISYGRSLVPFFEGLGHPPRAEKGDVPRVEAANFDLTQGIRVDDQDVARQLGRGDTGRAGFREVSKPAYRIGISRTEELRTGPNMVGVDERLFDRLGLTKSPWVQLTGPNGISIGAKAVRMRTGGPPILITGAIAEVLLNEGGTLTHLQMQPVAWRTNDAKRARDFAASRELAESQCDYWFSVGLSLEAMLNLGLVPGAYAEVGGPDGFQSVRVQLVDQGFPDEIWLSENVRESIGVEGSHMPVKVRPKS